METKAFWLEVISLGFSSSSVSSWYINKLLVTFLWSKVLFIFFKVKVFLRIFSSDLNNLDQEINGESSKMCKVGETLHAV